MDRKQTYLGKLGLFVLIFFFPLQIALASQINVSTTEVIPVSINISNSTLTIGINNSFQIYACSNLITTANFNWGFFKTVEVADTLCPAVNLSNINISQGSINTIDHNFEEDLIKAEGSLKSHFDANVKELCIANITYLTSKYAICLDNNAELENKFANINGSYGGAVSELDVCRTDNTLWMVGMVLILLAVIWFAMKAAGFNIISLFSRKHPKIGKGSLLD